MVTPSALLPVFLIAGVAGAAIAQHDEAEARAACKSDYEKLCADLIPGGRRIARCLESNVGRLHANCKSFIEAHTKKN